MVKNESHNYRNIRNLFLLYDVLIYMILIINKTRISLFNNEFLYLILMFNTINYKLVQHLHLRNLTHLI